MRLDHPFDHPDDRSGSVWNIWTDGPPNLSRLDPAGAVQVDPERPARNRTAAVRQVPPDGSLLLPWGAEVEAASGEDAGRRGLGLPARHDGPDRDGPARGCHRRGSLGTRSPIRRAGAPLVWRVGGRRTVMR